jgi:hypothetical protein
MHAEQLPIWARSLELPLVTSSGGHSYRISAGYLYAYASSSYAYLDLNTDAPSVSAALATGRYNTFVFGVSLARDDGTGNYVPVEAELVSNPNQVVDIYNGVTSTVTLEFETDGALVRVGSGNLAVELDVTEDGGVCTPLSTDCGEGSWCPPTELTGVPRACVTAGEAGLGETCSGPHDCTADSSCFDFGSGPVCAALCPAEQFDQPCAENSRCIAAGIEYGVCTPEPEAP